MPPLSSTYFRKESAMKKIECYLNEKTLQDLIAVHLQCMKFVHSSEDVTDVSITPSPSQEGMYIINFTIEPKTELIFHE
jgi:hypothetical protein